MCLSLCVFEDRKKNGVFKDDPANHLLPLETCWFLQDNSEEDPADSSCHRSDGGVRETW